MADDLKFLSKEWWAEARRKSAEDDAEVESWKDETRDGVSFFLPGANWSIWEWIERGLRSEFFWRDRVAGRTRRWDKR